MIRAALLGLALLTANLQAAPDDYYRRSTIHNINLHTVQNNSQLRIRGWIYTGANPCMATDVQELFRYGLDLGRRVLHVYPSNRVGPDHPDRCTREYNPQYERERTFVSLYDRRFNRILIHDVDRRGHGLLVRINRRGIIRSQQLLDPQQMAQFQ